MLVIYPTTDYTSMCSLADANTIITDNFQATQRTDWEALDDTDKESLLRQATLLIEQRVDEDNLPDTLEKNLKYSCAYLAKHSIAKDMTNEDGSGNVKRERVEGAVEVEYFAPKEDKSNEFPDIVESWLTKYDLSSSGSFSFNRS